MSRKNISIEYKILNADFRKKMKEIRGDITTLNKEFRLQQEQMRNSATYSEKLRVEIDNLGKRLEFSKEKTEAIKTAMEGVKNTLGENSVEYQRLNNQLLDSQREEERLKNAIENKSQKLEKAIEQEKQYTEEFRKNKQASEERKAKLKELEDSQNQVKSSSEKLTAQYELEKAKLGENASASEKLKLKQEYLAEAHKLTKDEVKNLEQQLEIAKKEFGENSEEVNRLEKELAETQKQAVEFGNAYAKATDKLDNAKRKFENIGKTLKATGKDLTAKVTVPIAGAFGGILKVSADFESQMSKVKAISKASGQEFEDLKNKARELGESTQYSASEVGSAMESMARAGWDSKEIINGVEGALYLAAASGEEFGTVTDHMLGIMGAFNMEASESSRIADLLASTAGSSKTNVGALGEAMSYVAPVSASLGFSVEETAKYLGLLANKGIEGSKAGTVLRGALTKLVKPSQEGARVMEELGITITDSEGNMKSLDGLVANLQSSFAGLSEEQQGAYLATLFGQEAMSGMSAIVNTTKTEMSDLEKATTDYTGSAKEIGEIANDNFLGRLKQLKSKLEEVAITLGKSLLPFAEKVVGVASNLATKFANTSETTQQVILAIAGIAAAVGPVLLVLGTMASSISEIITAIQVISKLGLIAKIGAILGPLKTIGVAIGGLIASIGAVPIAIGAAIVGIGVLIYKYWDEIKEFFSGIKEKLLGFWDGLGTEGQERVKTALKIMFLPLYTMFETITTIIDLVKAGMDNGWEGIKEVISQKWEGIIEVIKGAWNRISEIFMYVFEPIINAVTSGFEFVKEIITTIWNAIPEPIRLALESIFNFVVRIFEAIKSFIKTILEAIKLIIEAIFIVISEIFKRVWNSIFEFIKNIMNKMFNGIKFAWEKIKAFFEMIFGAIRSVFEYFWNPITEFVGSIFNKIKTTISNSLNSAKNVISGILGSIYNTFSSKFNAIYNTASSIFNRVKNAIATPVERARDIIRGAVNSIQRFFSNLKLPHFSLRKRTISFFDREITIPSGFDISWHAKGGIFTKPTILGNHGFGEAGKEAIVPLENKQHMKPFAEAVASYMNTQSQGNVVYITMENTIKETADVDRIFNYVDKKLNRQGFEIRFRKGGAGV